MGQKSSRIRQVEPVSHDENPDSAVTTSETDTVQNENLHNAVTTRETDAIQDERPSSEDSKYTDFAFLNNEGTKKYMQKSKIMFIMKGLPGSGKSFLVNKISKTFPGSVVCSADSFFYNNGVYTFDFTKLGDAHNSCKEAAIQAVQEQANVIIIDNTNVCYWEMKFYLHLASRFNYFSIIVEPKTPWRLDPEALAQKNSHEVDVVTLRSKIKIYEPLLPLYYGWFLNDIDSLFLLKMGKCWLERLMDLPEFQKSVRDTCQVRNSEDLIRYFCKGRKSLDKTRILHCTSRYTARQRPLDIEYSNQKAVQESISRIFHLSVIGFVVTRRTFGARVGLTESQTRIWGDDSNEDSEGATGSNMKRNRGPPARATDVLVPQYDLPEREISTNATLKVVPFTDLESKVPSHITLGIHTGVSPVETKEDLHKVIELEACPGEAVTYEIPAAKVRCFEKGIWVVYPRKMAQFDALFRCEV